MSESALECSSCSYHVREKAVEDLEIHEEECDGYDQAESRFDVDDRVRLSELGKRRLENIHRFDPETIRGRVVGFSMTKDSIVRVRWDGYEMASSYEHRFITHD